MKPIKTGLVEDDPQWLELMASTIHQAADLAIAWSTGDPKEALYLAGAKTPDLIIIDVKFTGAQWDGLDLARAITALRRVKIIMVSGTNSENLICQAFLSGAVNFIPKENLDELPGAIRAAFTKNRSYEILIGHYQRLYQELRMQSLTPSEKQIYLLYRQGRSIAQIALATQKSEGTVKNQISRARKKLKNQDAIDFKHLHWPYI
ncbi:MAG: response regulator transcription factor [Firmicutes bacterium]|nr:response regulator transcription factor [Bacillota bacterium]